MCNSCDGVVICKLLVFESLCVNEMKRNVCVCRVVVVCMCIAIIMYYFEVCSMLVILMS